MCNPNNPLPIKDIKFTIKNLPEKKAKMVLLENSAEYSKQN